MGKTRSAIERWRAAAKRIRDGPRPFGDQNPFRLLATGIKMPMPKQITVVASAGKAGASIPSISPGRICFRAHAGHFPFPLRVTAFPLFKSA
jgi:hypothetical protein